MTTESKDWTDSLTRIVASVLILFLRGFLLWWLAPKSGLPVDFGFFEWVFIVLSVDLLWSANWKVRSL